MYCIGSLPYWPILETGTKIETTQADI